MRLFPRNTATLLVTGVVLLQASTASAQKITYQEHVEPIFRSKCYSCHSTQKKTADLDLSSYSAMMAGGASGEPITPGSPDDSYLFNLVTHDSEPKMPPNSEKIPAAMIDTLRKWIEGGALENAGSKAMTRKPGADLSLKAPSTGKPEGPPPMPDVLSLSPVVLPRTTTAVTAIATSPWAPLVALAGQKQVTLYHSATLEPLGVLPFPEGTPEVLRFSRNGQLLLAGGGRGAYKGRVVVWNIKTGERVIEVGDELDSILGADISSDQSLIALGGPGKVVRVYTTHDGELAYEITKHTDWVYDVEFSPDSVLLATSDRNGGLHVWEAVNGREYLTLPGHKGGIRSVSWRGDSNLLASGSEDGTIKLWEMENGKQVRSINAHGGGVASIEFTRDGHIASCGRDRVTKLFDVAGKALKSFEAFGDLALSVSFCDETKRVIAGDWSGTVRVWNSADAKRVSELAQNPLPLQQRLDAAKAQLAEREKQATAQTAAATNAVAARDKSKAALAAAQQALAAAQKLNTESTQQLAKVKASMDALKKEIAAMVPREAAAVKAAPQLKQAAEQSRLAAAAVPEDKELATLAATLLKKSTAKDAELKQLQTDLTAKRAAEKTAVTQSGTLQKQITGSAATIKKSQQDIANLQKQLPPLEENVAKTAAAAKAATAARDTGKQVVARWTHYVSLETEIKALTDLQGKLQQEEVAAAEIQEQVKAAEDALTAARQEVTQLTQQQQAATAQAETMKKTIATLNTERDAATAAAAKLEAALPALVEVHKNTAAIAKQSGDDKEIAAAAEQLRLLAEKKTAAHAALKKTATDKDALAKKTTADMAVVNKKATELATAMQTATKKAEKMAKDMEPVVAQATAAQQKVTQAKEQVDKALQVVETRKQQIRPLLPTAA